MPLGDSVRDGVCVLEGVGDTEGVCDCEREMLWVCVIVALGVWVSDGDSVTVCVCV